MDKIAPKDTAVVQEQKNGKALICGKRVMPTSINKREKIYTVNACDLQQMANGTLGDIAIKIGR